MSKAVWTSEKRGSHQLTNILQSQANNLRSPDTSWFLSDDTDRENSAQRYLASPRSIPGQTCTSVSLPHSHLIWLHTSLLGGSVYSTQASGGSVSGTKAALLLCLSHRGRLLKPLSGAPGPTQQASKFPHRGPPALTSSELDFGGRVISLNHPISHSCTMTGGPGFTPNLPGN